ncbi:MAG: DUF1343 domain-containing protein [Flavisolibacter sp.]
MNIDSIKNQFHDIGLLANQTSWHPSKNAYLAQVLDKHLKRVFVPEHGFFAELQDQETLDDTSAYNFLNPYAEFVSVYGSDKQHTLRFTSSQLSDLDCIIVDIQDVGVRYFTYITTMFYLFEALKNNDIGIPVFVTNRPNPNIGRVEGTPLQAAYQSFIGVEGLPHCYGLSLLQLAKWLQAKVQNTNEVLPFDYKEDQWIQPSPNISTAATCHIYPGMCLLEGTIMSEGRGTTMPFHIFGSPDLPLDALNAICGKLQQITAAIPSLANTWNLRPLKFIPTFHKHAGLVCNGFQLEATAPGFHSLLFALLLLKETSRYFDREKFWRLGAYEFGNDKTAIELLAGDTYLLEYLFGEIPPLELWDYLTSAEANWSSDVKDFAFPF